MRFALTVAFGAIVLSLAGTGARAQTAPLSPEARKEAAERFDRGLRLFNQGENAGALVEFKRTYELTGDPSTLLNIGLVYAELRRPVDAVEALDTLLKSSAKLAPEQRQKAERVRAEQWTFVSFLQIDTNVTAAIEVDGVEAAHTPLSGTLRVAAGHHVVGAVAAGYPPSRKTIDIAGGETEKLSFVLVPGEAALAHLALHCSLPAGDVWVDGNASGRTPLTQTLALNPGPHHVEVRRDGYRTASADIKLDLGAVADVTLEPEIDTAALAQTGGSLAITASETGAEVAIDGRPPEALAGAIRLPVGPHHLLITRAGFEPTDLDVTIARGATFNTTVNLQADAQTRDAYLAGIHTRRLWGWTVGGVGVAALITGSVLFAIGHSDLDSANTNYNTVYNNLTGYCNPKYVLPASCAAMLDAANQRIDDANTKLKISYVVAGVGAAAAVTGAVLLLTNDDPAKYDRRTSSARRPTLLGWTTGSGGGVLLMGRF
ncbi:MAG TPA: PEGA domain-containing protein [Polyangia bacterium]|jgi:hypothetical protein